jgi:flagellar assembly protein FliH
MTSISHRYADFSPFDTDGEIADPVPLDRVEDQKLQSFEEGYQAGWTDAETNQQAENKNIADEILHTLRDLSFTYEEALARLNRGLKPMFEHIMTTLLPQTASAALRAHVIEQLSELAATQTQCQISLVVAQTDYPMLEELLEGVELKLPVSLQSDETFAPHQIFVGLDTLEREINLGAICQEITTAMNAFNFHSQTECPDD